MKTRWEYSGTERFVEYFQRKSGSGMEWQFLGWGLVGIEGEQRCG
jgi:hypothetical protein